MKPVVGPHHRLSCFYLYAGSAFILQAPLTLSDLLFNWWTLLLYFVPTHEKQQECLICWQVLYTSSTYPMCLMWTVRSLCWPVCSHPASSFHMLCFSWGVFVCFRQMHGEDFVCGWQKAVADIRNDLCDMNDFNLFLCLHPARWSSSLCCQASCAREICILWFVHYGSEAWGLRVRVVRSLPN